MNPENTRETAISDSIRYLSTDEALESIRRNPYWPKWNSPWWHMSVLFEMGLGDRIPRKAAEVMLAEVKRTHIPYFFPHELPSDRADHEEPPCPCALGNLLQFLRSAGLDVEASLPWARGWFLKYQMSDGGMNCDDRAYQSGEVASSIVGTIAAIESFVTSPKKLTADEEKFVDEAARFLIDRELRFGSKSDYNAAERDDEADWLKLCFPRFYFYDVLRGLTCLLKWSELRNKPIPEKSIRFVTSFLESQFRDGKIKIGRHSYENTNTPNVDSENQLDWKNRVLGSHFALMDQTSEIGMTSPDLTKRWSEAQELLTKLKMRGLIAATV